MAALEGLENGSDCPEVLAAGLYSRGGVAVAATELLGEPQSRTLVMRSDTSRIGSLTATDNPIVPLISSHQTVQAVSIYRFRGQK